MKIDTKFHFELNFNTSGSISKQENKVFEAYLKNALLELERADFLKQAEKEKLKYLSEKLDSSLALLDRVTKLDLNFSTSATIGDLLLSQAYEMEKIAETLPEGGLKFLFKESALYIGLEAEKLRNGFYLR